MPDRAELAFALDARADGVIGSSDTDGAALIDEQSAPPRGPRTYELVGEAHVRPDRPVLVR